MTAINDYPAHAFHDQLAKGRASGTLLVNDFEVRFSSGAHSVRFPLAGLQVELGGASNRLVYLRHPAQPDWTLYTSDRRLLNHPLLQAQPAVQAQLRQAKRGRLLGWSVLALVALLIVGTPLLLLTQLDWVTGLIARQIPVEWEDKLGKSVYAQYQSEHEILDSAAGKAALAQLTAPLIAAADGRYRYHIVVSDDPELNAFALPGGYVVINSGLILKADNANEVLGVLAHELSHVSEQHGVRNIIGGAGLYVVLQGLIGDVSGVLAVVANAAPLLLHQSYSRGFERAADQKGFELLQRAQLDPRGMISFFTKVIAEEKQQLEKIKDEQARELMQDSMGFLSSHPATADRITALEKRLPVPAPAYRSLEPPFRQLKAEVQALVAATATDASAHNKLKD